MAKRHAEPADASEALGDLELLSKRARIDTPDGDDDAGDPDASEVHGHASSVLDERNSVAADEAPLRGAQVPGAAQANGITLPGSGGAPVQGQHLVNGDATPSVNGNVHASTDAAATGATATDAVPDDTAPVATMGVIERVDMINFMCHRHLSIPLGPRINFIIGHNGSGKSAILIALTIALGGKASSTSRGSSLKDFIREGASAAEITVRLCNRGPEAYQPAAYGDVIVIERRINADGSGHWRLRSAEGRVVSTKREELEAICDHANIQVDNPMNILSQDAARQFLGSSAPEDKYSFFLRGTQLTQLAQEYELIQTNIQRMKRALAITEETLPELERDAREANAKWRLVEQARAEQEKLNALKDELVWSQVIAKERELAATAEQLERARAKCAALERKQRRDQERAAQLDASIAEIEQRGRESSERERTLSEQRAEVVRAYNDRRSALQVLRTRERELSEQADRIQRTVTQLQHTIDQETRKLAEDRAARRARQEARRDELRQRAVEREMALATHHEQADSLVEERTALERRGAEARAARMALEEKAAHLEQFIARCEQAAANHITAFGGPAMPRVLDAIAREQRWRDVPVGPIGTLLHLRDARWAPVVEAVLGDALNAFCVTNHADRERLARILRQHQCRNQIYTAPRDEFEFAQGEPEAGVTTLLRVLEVDDAYVTRTLVNALNVEKSALVQERAQGDVLMRRNLRNVQQCFSADLFKITGGPAGSSTQTVTRATGPPRFARDTSAEVAEAQAALREQRAAHAARLQEARSVDAELRALAQRIREHERAAQAQKGEVRSLREAMAQVEDEMREDEPVNVAAFEAALADARGEMERVVEQFRLVEADKVRAEEALAPVAEQRDRLQEQIEILEAERRGVEQELQTTFAERLRLRNNEAHWATQLEAQTSAAQEAERREHTLAQQVDDWTRQALAYCARVETSRSAESLERQIHTIEQQIEEANRHSGLQLDTVVRELREKNRAFQEAKRQLENTHRTIALLDQAIHVRLEKWHYFRRFVAIRARANFSMHLQNRGFSGSLHFDHNAQKLKLRVQTGDASQPYEKDPKSLSGGEKSFATICLLLALWEAIGCPIRCLDEFDVFMDAVNRKVSMRMIVRRQAQEAR